MTELKHLLRRDPEGYDEFGRLLYPLSTTPDDLKHQTNELMSPRAYPYIRRIARAVRREIAREVVRHSAAPRIVLLDVGGGPGRLFDFVRAEVATYVNVDPTASPPTEDESRRLRDPRYVRVLASGQDLPLADSSVDVAVALSSLDHMPDHRQALAEIARVTRPGGLVIALLNNRRSWWKVLLANTDLWRRREAAIAREHYIQLSLQDLVAELAAFFRPVRAYTTTFVPYVPIAWRVLLPLADAIGSKVMPRAGANSIVVCRRP